MKLQSKIMIVAFSLVLSTIALPVVAQTQLPSNLDVTDPKFIYDVNSKFNFRADNWTSSKRSPFTSDILQEMSALFHNVGSKTVEEVTWEFIMYKDAKYSDAKQVYTLHSKINIAPGESIRLSKVGLIQIRSLYREAKVLRIKYTDGTIWNGVKTND